MRVTQRSRTTKKSTAQRKNENDSIGREGLDGESRCHRLSLVDTA